MIALRELIRKEGIVLFASPIAYLVLMTVAILTSIVFFEHLRLYNQQLFLFASNNMGGFESDSIPEYINLRDTVFYPAMEQLGLLLLLPISLISMRVFARERDTGSEELLLTSGVSSATIVVAKFVVTQAFIFLMTAISFIYPLSTILQGGLGLEHLLASFLGLLLLGSGIASIGLFCSALTRSQVIAAAATVAVAYVLYDFGWTYGISSPGVAYFLDSIALHTHFTRFAEGLVSISDITYFVSLGLAAAGLSHAALEWRRISG